MARERKGKRERERVSTRVYYDFKRVQFHKIFARIVAVKQAGCDEAEGLNDWWYIVCRTRASHITRCTHTRKHATPGRRVHRRFAQNVYYVSGCAVRVDEWVGAIVSHNIFRFRTKCEACGGGEAMVMCVCVWEVGGWCWLTQQHVRSFTLAETLYSFVSQSVNQIESCLPYTCVPLCVCGCVCVRVSGMYVICVLFEASERVCEDGWLVGGW